VQRLADAERERGAVEHPHLLTPGGNGDGQRGDHDHPGEVDAHHRRAAVEPVGKGAGREGDEKPGSRPTSVTAAKAPGSRVMPEGDQRQGDLKDPVGEVRRPRGGQHPPEVAVGRH
jgi:hypothetical protein